MSLTPSAKKEENSYKEKYEIIKSQIPSMLEKLMKISPAAEEECSRVQKLVDDPLNYTPQFGSHLVEEKSLSMRIESEEGADGKSPVKDKAKEENVTVPELKQELEEYEKYTEKLEAQIIKMNEWDERSEIQIIQLQSMIHTILKKYFLLVN